jgi:hypothetical protein
MNKFDEIYKKIISENSDIISESTTIDDHYEQLGYYDSFVLGANITEILSVFTFNEREAIIGTYRETVQDPFNLIIKDDEFWLIYPFVNESKRQRARAIAVTNLIRTIKDVENTNNLKNKYESLLKEYGEDPSNFKNISEIIDFLFDQVDADVTFGYMES